MRNTASTYHAFMHFLRTHRARLQVRRMQEEKARAHRQDSCAGGSQKYPSLQDMDSQKKETSGSNEPTCSSVLHITVFRDDMEMSRVTMKFKRNLEFWVSLSNQSNGDCLFGCCLRLLIAALSKAM